MYNHFCTSPDIIVNGFKAIACSIDAGEPVLDDIVPYADGSRTSKSDKTDDSDDDYDSDDVSSGYFSSDDEQRV